MILTSGCAHYADLSAGTVKAIATEAASPVVEQEQVNLTAPLEQSPPSNDYVVGAGDVLFVQVNGKPELGSPTVAGSKVQGSRVDGSGVIRLPIVGNVTVGGMTIAQAGAALQDAYATYLRDPSVVVEVAEFKSQPLYLLGQFKSAGVYYMDRPLTLLQGLALGGGFDPTANYAGARLIRDNKTIPVDIYALLMQGGTNQNIWLKAGDSVYVPDNRSLLVFVFGAVKKPGPVTYPQGGLNLAQAIASAELRDFGVNSRRVRIIRSHSVTRGELIVVDFAKIVRGEALPFMLKEGDIVYVPKSGIGTWNDAINEILPSLQAVSALLNPFVQIKFLSED